VLLSTAGLALAATALAAVLTPTASAAALPHNIDGGVYAGYEATLSDITSVSVNWVQPSTSCGSTEVDNFDVEIVLSNADAHALQDAAFVTCGLGQRTDTEVQRTVTAGPVPRPGNSHSHALVPGDSMSAAIGRFGSVWVLTLADNTAGWTAQWPQPNPSSSYDTVGIRLLNYSDNQHSPVVFTDATVNGRPLAAADPVGLDSAQAGGQVDRTGPLSGGDFTVSLVDS
jgi:hypothetical protein